MQRVWTRRWSPLRLKILRVELWSLGPGELKSIICCLGEIEEVPIGNQSVRVSLSGNDAECVSSGLLYLASEVIPIDKKVQSSPSVPGYGLNLD